MPYTKLGDINKLSLESGFSAENLTLILTMDNILVFHDNVACTFSSAVKMCTLPKYSRPSKMVVFQCACSDSMLNDLGTATFVIQPSGDIMLMHSTLSGEIVLYLNGVTVSVSDYYYNMNKDQGFTNTAPTTAIALMKAMGVIEEPSYTNILDTVGFTNGKYASEPQGKQGTDSSYWCSGVIKWDNPGTTPLYIKGWTYNTSASHSRIYGSDTASGGINPSYGYCSSSRISSFYNVETISGDYVKFTAKTYPTGTRYVAISMPGKGDNVIISVGNPIE